MSHDRSNPPSEWLGSAVKISDDIYAAWFTDTEGVEEANPIIWHWCPVLNHWEGSGTPLHTLVSREPLHLEASLLFNWCCGLHGFIRDGKWVGV